jgi:hypothetical protein
MGTHVIIDSSIIEDLINSPDPNALEDDEGMLSF